MAKFTFITLFVSFCLFLFASAAPLHSRQVGNLQCNLNRLAIVSNLSKTKKAVAAIGQASNDEATQQAVTDAQTSLTMASDGIKDIAKSLLKGAKAPASARDMVFLGLTGAANATMSIDVAADDNVAEAVNNAMELIAKCEKNGKGVVDTCK